MKMIRCNLYGLKGVGSTLTNFSRLIMYDSNSKNMLYFARS
jgi:hypothetical protein